jgi:F0F1-type ATP synthase assembly protein I
MSLASLNELKDARLFLVQARSTWRILLLIAAIQLAAGSAALYLGVFADAFISFWFGGAIMSLPAFLVGFYWQYVSARTSLVTCKPILTLYALSSAVISLVAWPMATFQSTVLRSAV